MFFMLLGSLEIAKATDQSSNSNGDPHSWPMFHSDPTHSGVGAGSPLLNPSVLWSYNTSSDGGGHVYSSPTISNGVVYISSWIFNIVNKMFVPNYGNVYALNAVNGAELWNHTIGPVEMSSPTVVNDVVYIWDLNGNIYALNAVNGTKLWNYTTGNSAPNIIDGYIYSSPTVVDGRSLHRLGQP